MKALELAEYMDGCSHPMDVGIEKFDEIKAELRRLTEVNAALLKAINELSVTAESTKPGEFSVASHALFALRAAANKAKEQQ